MLQEVGFQHTPCRTTVGTLRTLTLNYALAKLRGYDAGRHTVLKGVAQVCYALHESSRSI